MKNWNDLTESVKGMKAGEYIVFSHSSGDYKLSKIKDAVSEKAE